MRALIAGLVLLILVGCEAAAPSADHEQARQTEAITAQAQAEIGMPGITNFTERRLVRMLYELRDQEGYATYTYIVDMNGSRHLLCESIGYGIPYAVQFSNPTRTVDRSPVNGFVEQLPQPEPNGLFMPDALSATWVMCADGEQTRPVYVEPQVVVSPFPLEAAQP